MQDYLAVSVQDLRQREYSPLPWTTAQERFAKARQPVRLLKGHPGSGKTSALWSWPANVSITDDGGGSPQTVTLTGRGT
ncbi:MAG: hypothetical protein H0X25_21685 [Acidobacteriales bacterium]|nr:hypothetical protein [Terriglobales bacterium]